MLILARDSKVSVRASARPPAAQASDVSASSVTERGATWTAIEVGRVEVHGRWRADKDWTSGSA